MISEESEEKICSREISTNATCYEEIIMAAGNINRIKQLYSRRGTGANDR